MIGMRIASSNAEMYGNAVLAVLAAGAIAITVLV
jgi:hypothetical protein